MRAAILGLVLLSACADDFIFLPSGGLPSLFLFEVEHGAVTATAYDLSADDAKLEVPVPSAGVTLYALFFAEKLAQLGVAPGPVPLALMGKPLPAARTHHRFATPEWIVLNGLPDEIANLQIATPDPCVAFDLTRSPFPFTRPSFAATIDPERLFVGTEEQLVVVTAAGVSAVRGVPPAVAGFARGSELWLVGRDGSVTHGDPARGFDAVPPLPAPPIGPTTITGSGPDAPLELFVADSTMKVLHFNGAAWQQIRTNSPVRDVMPLRPRMAWIEPSLAVLIGAGTSSIVEITATGAERVIELELPPRTTLDTPWSIGFVEGVGMLIGTRYEVLFRRVGRSWELLPTPPRTPRADVIVDLGNATFIAGGQNGVFVQWGPGNFLCDTMVFGAGGASVAGKLGERVVIISSDDAGVVFNTFIGTRAQ